MPVMPDTGARESIGNSGDSGDPVPSPPAGWRRRTFAAVAILVALIVAAVISRNWSNDEPTAATASTIDQQTRAVIDKAVTDAVAENGFSADQVYDKIVPSLVYIEVSEQDGTGSPAGDRGTGLGTGVVINGDGEILTALHVVDGSSSIDVVFADGTRSAAKIIASDPDNDIATLSSEVLPSLVVPAVLGSSQGVSIGDPVVAVGNPLGLIGTTTAGVVSGLDRSVEESDHGQLDGLIQFDAAVNPGSSGGPLLNSRAETIGIVVALADPSKDGFFIGIGFAVPVGVAIGGAGGGPPK
jgi:S1-C subfamily serine protease